MDNTTKLEPGIILGVDFKIKDINISGTFDKKSGWLLGSVKDIPLNSLVPDEISDIVPSLNINKITAGYRKSGKNGTQYFISSLLSTKIDLLNFPLLGDYLSSDQGLNIEGLSFSITGIKNDKKSSVNIMISANINAGGSRLPISIPVHKSSEKQNAEESHKKDIKQLSTQRKTPSKSEGLWFTLDKSFGPITIKRIGINYRNSILSFLLDTSMTMGPVNVTLIGLSAGSKLDNFNPEFSLDGLGLSYKSGPIELSGLFLYDKNDNSYTGMATIKTSSISISAMGSYKDLDGQPSLFIYGVFNSAVGAGPPFFQVTGISAGFGYNRTLVIPEIHKIMDFPLVSAAMGKDYGNDPIEVLSNIKKYIPSAPDEMFFALGVIFTSFKMLNSFALLLIRLGEKIKMDILGVSRLTVPCGSDEPLAQVELAIKASYDFYENSLKVMGVLTDSSYILSRNCRLTGGFAFYSWFEGVHCGDFVFTMGGYHPDFKKPAHYPSVPRLGFHWQISKELSIKGEMYYALVSTALMAGGKMEALFEIERTVGFDIGVAGASLTGKIRAWFIIGADFIISWKPYYYSAEVYLKIGITASFRGRVKFLFIKKTITMSFDLNLSAGLKIWGPEFAGRAHVDWSIISFDIKFGSQDKPKPVPLSWTEFKQSFLPETKEIASLSVTDGLITREENGIFIINPSNLMITSNSIIPSTSYNIGKNIPPKVNIKSFGIASMDIKEIDKSEHIINIYDGLGNNVTDQFIFIPQYKNYPESLWGSKFKIDMNSENAIIKDMLTGFNIVPKPKKKPDITEEKMASDFDYDLELREESYNWTETITVLKDNSDDLARSIRISDIGCENKVRSSILESLNLKQLPIDGRSLTKSFISIPQIVQWEIT